MYRIVKLLFEQDSAISVKYAHSAIRSCGIPADHFSETPKADQSLRRSLRRMADEHYANGLALFVYFASASSGLFYPKSNPLFLKYMSD